MAWIGGIIIFVFGIPSALSFGILSDVQILNRSIFDFVDFITNSVGMPIGALLISIFAGYYYTKDISRKELASSSLMLTFGTC